MTPVLTTNDMFEAQSAALKLHWAAGLDGRSRLLEPATAKYPGMALVGHLNFVHSNRVQVLGDVEIEYLETLDTRERAKALHDLCTCERTAAVILANGHQLDPDLKSKADSEGMPLFSTPLASPLIIDHLQYYLARALAPRVTVHGVYMEVMGMGVLITGESGIGKSELALELLSRNHRLITDDAVEIIRVAPDVLVGQCPTALSDYLEVRGMGILDVRMMFGETAVRHKKRLHMIVRMVQLQKSEAHQIDRLAAQQLTRRVLDVEIPEVVLYVGPGRNLAVLVETATRTHILRTWGFNPLDDFMKRQQGLIKDGSAPSEDGAAGPSSQGTGKDDEPVSRARARKQRDENAQ